MLRLPRGPSRAHAPAWECLAAPPAARRTGRAMHWTRRWSVGPCSHAGEIVKVFRDTPLSQGARLTPSEKAAFKANAKPTIEAVRVAFRRLDPTGHRAARILSQSPERGSQNEMRGAPPLRGGARDSRTGNRKQETGNSKQRTANQRSALMGTDDNNRNPLRP